VVAIWTDDPTPFLTDLVILIDKCMHYCREPIPETQEKRNKNVMERAKANDPAAICGLGKICHEEGDYEGAVQYYTKAAELGDIIAHFNLSLMYYKLVGTHINYIHLLRPFACFICGINGYSLFYGNVWYEPSRLAFSASSLCVLFVASIAA
jgi:tetratricopeptide (TPR) repeat protein